ncbi:MAG: hypothetical protein PHR35_02075, partial [Kiritimatiellae bacterium]|nr:hypothetical protein [Kiritimatiellia bacterium]
MPGNIYAAVTIDTEFPVSWDNVEARLNSGNLARLSRNLAIPFTWMIKVSAQDERAVAEHFFSQVHPLLPQNHEVGLHVHFDDEHREQYIDSPEDRERLIRAGHETLKAFGCSPRTFRAGCLRLEPGDLDV